MKRIIAGAALAVAAVPLAAGTALADEAPSAESAAADSGTQSPLQGASAGLATAEQLVAQFVDASDGNGPTGADGVETEVPTPDPRLVEGPVGGLLNGPFD